MSFQSKQFVVEFIGIICSTRSRPYRKEGPSNHQIHKSISVCKSKEKYDN